MNRIRIAHAGRSAASLLGGRRDSGFTLVELLVVVIIIGILAAIAIPVYVGVQNNAKDGAVKSDLADAQTALVAYYTAGGTTTVTTANAPSLLATYGYKKSENVDTISITSTPTPTSFCISAKRTGGAAGDTFYVTQAGGISKTAC